MKPDTEQCFGTIEVLSQHDQLPFLWDTATHGDFDLWNLLRSEGLVKPTDPEIALTHWQNMEQWGAPTDLKEYEYARLRSERKDDGWSEAIALERQAIYQQLQHYLHTNLTELQAYTLAIPGSRRFEWEHPDFSVSIIVGKTDDHQWLCLAPTVPDQMDIQKRNHYGVAKTEAINSLIESSNHPNQIQTPPILKQLKPIVLYGYYEGGYNYTYSHQIMSAVAASENQAIVQALNAAQMIGCSQPVSTSHRTSHNKDVFQFMNQSLYDRHCVSISFWDLYYIYEIGKTLSGDWVGVRSFMEFEYNP